MNLAVFLAAEQLLLDVVFGQRPGRDADQGFIGAAAQRVQVARKGRAAGAGLAAQ